MVEETQLGVQNLIYPIFLKDGKGIKEEVSSLPNNFRWSIDQLLPEIEACLKLGITTYVYAGALNNPTPTLTGSVLRDVMVIEKMLGVKIRVADFRAYMNSSMELVNLAKEALSGAQHSGKKGVIHIHVGRAPERMEQLEKWGVTDYLKPPWTAGLQATKTPLAEKLEEMAGFARKYGLTART